MTFSKIFSAKYTIKLMLPPVACASVYFFGKKTFSAKLNIETCGELKWGYRLVCYDLQAG